MMTHKDRILAVLNGERPDRIPWVPDLEHWYAMNRIWGTLPEKYRQMCWKPDMFLNLLSIHRDLDVGHLVMDGFWYSGGYIKDSDLEEDIEVIRKVVTYFPTTVRVVIKTPIGEVTSAYRITEDGYTHYPIECPIKRRSFLKDFEVMIYVYKQNARKNLTYNYETYYETERLLGDLGLVRHNSPRSPLSQLLIADMKFEDAIYALHAYPKEMERLMIAISESHEKVFDLLGESPVKYISLGENLNAMFSPKLFKKYCVPYYQKITAALHKKCKFCLIHSDGNVKHLLPLMKETGADGLEALTLEPQGDVNLEDVKTLIEDGLIVHALLPATYFDTYTNVSYDEVKKLTKEILEIFDSMGLILLAVDDNFPPTGDIEKIRYISKIIEKWYR